MRAADPDAMALLRTMGARRRQLLRRIRIPSALPQFFTGLKVAVTYAYVSAIFAEYVGGTQGLGVYMQVSKNNFRTELVFGAIIATTLLTLALFLVVAGLERAALPWRRPLREARTAGELGRRPSHGGARLRGRAGCARPTGPGDELVTALAGVDVVAEPGEFVAVIGPSGSGKSTLFHILAGLEDPDAGAVLFDGRGAPGSASGPAHSCPSATACSRGTAHDRQRHHRTRARPGSRASDARERARPLIERFGLGGFERAWPWQLSGGMRHRAAFLRTVLLGRRVMLLDEPFGALDGITRADLQQWLLEVWSEVRTTVVLITHDVAEAVFLADRVYVFSPRPGRVAAELDIELPRPRSLETLESPPSQSARRELREALRAAVAQLARRSSGNAGSALQRGSEPSYSGRPGGR